jgi:ribose 5-phosphate isomerase B
MATTRQLIAIGADHAGYEYKTAVIRWLEEHGYSVFDAGTDSEESVDYPDFIHPVADMVESGEADFGVIICGSGNGTAMTANKHQGIRAALTWTNELAALARQHNNANIISLPARFVSEELAIEMVDTFLHTDFEGGRHQRRVDKISCA